MYLEYFNKKVYCSLKKASFWTIWEGQKTRGAKSVTPLQKTLKKTSIFHSQMEEMRANILGQILDADAKERRFYISLIS